LENLSLIAEFISRAIQKVAKGKDILEVQTAVDEACSNIIKYAYSTNGGTIAINCEIKHGAFVVIIRDKGKPFDPNSVPPPELRSDLDNRKIGGLGIYLMKKLMDDVSYSYDLEEGNKLVMRRRLTRKT
jgi:anti-sigma regulatory factor (Ser/Thr protein kinase)